MTAPWIAQRMRPRPLPNAPMSWVRRNCPSQFQRLPAPEKSGMPTAARLSGLRSEMSGLSEPIISSVRDQSRRARAVRSRGSGKSRRSPAPFCTPPKKSTSMSPVNVAPATLSTDVAAPRRVCRSVTPKAEFVGGVDAWLADARAVCGTSALLTRPDVRNALVRICAEIST